MASGSASFALLANDGAADFVLTATNLLQARLLAIMQRRLAMGAANTLPTLTDIAQSHVIYTNSSFKPFVAVNYEYVAHRMKTGTLAFGQTVSFEFPAFGDFVYDMVLNVVTKTLQATAGGLTVPSAGDGNFGTTSSPNKYELVDAFGATQSGTYRNLSRWCEYPGIRLLDEVSLNLSSAAQMDRYSYYTAMMRMKFMIAPNKMTGFKRMVGQEMPCEGTGGPRSCTVKNTGFSIASTTSSTAPQLALEDVFGSYSSGYADTARKQISVLNGAQTPKDSHLAQAWWIPVDFWFTRDVRQVVPSASIPFGNRTIDIKLAAQDQMIHEYPNCFVKKTTGVVSTSTTSFASTTVIHYPYSTADDTAGTVHSSTAIPKGGFTTADVGLTSATLYVNNLFLNPEVHEIYVNRVGFLLVRLTREQKTTVSAGSDDTQLLSQLKWPIEYAFVGIRPQYNTSTANINMWRDWHRMTLMVDADIATTAVAELNGYAALTTSEVTSSRQNVVNDTYAVQVPTVTTLGVQLHSIALYPTIATGFYSDFTPFHLGGQMISTPEDKGALMINFSLYPGSFQPSGHINVSRAREFYVIWNSNYLSSTTQGDLIVSASAINFLLITDGTALLRFTT